MPVRVRNRLRARAVLVPAVVALVEAMREEDTDAARVWAESITDEAARAAAIGSLE